MILYSTYLKRPAEEILTDRRAFHDSYRVDVEAIYSDNPFVDGIIEK